MRLLKSFGRNCTTDIGYKKDGTTHFICLLFAEFMLDLKYHIYGVAIGIPFVFGIGLLNKSPNK